MEGEVLLEVVILKRGLIGPIRILRSLDLGLDLNAIRCVRQWRFTPGTFEGAAVDVITEIEVEYSIV